MSLSSVASTGDQLKTLMQLRDDLAGRLDQASSDQNYATMARIFTDTIDKIASIEGKAKGHGGTALDELEQRRAANGRPNATSSVGSSRTAKRG